MVARTDQLNTIRISAFRTKRLSRFPLSPREIEVLLLVSEGKTDPEIASEFFISRKTARVHVSRITEKLGVFRRVEAAGIAHAWA